MDQIVLGVMAIIGFGVFVAIIGVLNGHIGQPETQPVRLPNLYGRPTWEDDPDNPWMPLDTSSTGSYASTSQGGKVVGYVEVRRLHLRPGWQAGQKGMRPYTREAKEAWRRDRRGSDGRTT